MNYATKQKDQISELIASKTTDFTAKDLISELADSGISQATVYRAIEQLQKDGKLKKAIASDGSTRYQYLKECDHKGHCYLKCDRCNQIKHVDCETVSKLAEHIRDEHGFSTNLDEITITGICKNCKKGAK